MPRTIFTALLAALVPLGAAAQEAEPSPFDPHSVDLPALIACRDTPENFMALAVALQDPLNAVSLGWRPLPQTNMFLSEYALTAPIEVFGHRSDHIAFAGSSVMAILDLPDPRPLAKELELETAIDTPEKAMFGKELVSEEIRDDASGLVLIRSLVLNVSNVTSHPGKTLVGCTYSIDPEEENPDELEPQATGEAE
ncbi:hypothetical protein [Pseudoxanthomonas wuyuanensis]